MGMSRNIGAYADIPPVLDAAIAAGGATFRLSTSGQAYRWRTRAYYYRKLLHEQQAIRLANILDSRSTFTPYDSIRMTISGDTVNISVEGPPGVLLDGAGRSLELSKVTPLSMMNDPKQEFSDEDNEMLEELKGELGLEVNDE